jgi:two-component system cell cycle sensor histidine kinase/response regulator CckA
VDGTAVEVEATEILYANQSMPTAQIIVREISRRRQAEVHLCGFSTLGRRLSAAQTANEAAQIIADVAVHLLGWDACRCDLYSPAEDLMRTVLALGNNEGRHSECSAGCDRIRPSSTTRRAIEEGGQLILRGQRDEMRSARSRVGDAACQSASLMVIPIRAGANVIGVLSIQSDTPNAYDQSSLETLQAMADHCGGALDRIRSQEALNERAQLSELEEELRWKTAFLEAHVNSSLDGIMVVDNRGKKVLQNQRSIDLWKLPPHIAADSDDAKQIEFIMKMTKNPQQFFEKVVHLNSHPTEVSREEIELTDGTVLDRYSSPAVGKDGVHYGRIWRFRDITESRKLEAQFRQQQKMEAIGQLAGGVAHDFNNLLTVIRGNTEFLLMGAGPFTRQTTDCLKQVVAATDRAAGLTRQLLLFGRKQVMQTQPLNLTDVVGNLTKMLKRIIGENIDLQLRYAGRPPFVRADVGMIEQVLVNLVVNARDAMPHGGQLVISVKSIRFARAETPRHPEARAGAFVCLSVADAGTGIAPEHLPHIFEPFYTTKDLGKGSGLGLATVFGIVKEHLGWIEVSSKLGSGCTFKIFLPAIPPPANTAATPQTEPDLRGGTETILLVEDDDSVRLIARRVLESHGYKIYEARSGREALELWRSRGEEITLLLSDIIMPGGITGRELAEQLLAQRPALKVIFVSGYTADVIGKDTDFFRRSRSHLLHKPCSPRTLLTAIRRCLDGKRAPRATSFRPAVTAHPL